MLRESLSPVVLVGAALIVPGVAIVNARFGQRRLAGRSHASSEA